MSYFKYLDGRVNIKYIKEGESFVTWSIIYHPTLKQRAIYIRDIYVADEDRKKGLASSLADKVIKESPGHTVMIGTTDLLDNDVELSMQAQLGYGFKFLEIDLNHIMWWVKEIQ